MLWKKHSQYLGTGEKTRLRNVGTQVLFTSFPPISGTQFFLELMNHSLVNSSFPYYIYPAENIQTSAGDHWSTLQHQRMSNATPLASEDIFFTLPCYSDWQWDKHHTTGQRRRCFQLFWATLTDSGQWSSEPDGKEFHCSLSVRVASNSRR